MTLGAQPLCHEDGTCLIRGISKQQVESSWNVMAHGDAWEGKWRTNWRMEWAANTLHTTSEHDVSSITTADAHTSAASSWLNWRPGRFKWTHPFRRKTKSGFCACAITFQMLYTIFCSSVAVGTEVDDPAAGLQTHRARNMIKYCDSSLCIFCSWIFM
jgi:hypothetical protein